MNIKQELHIFRVENMRLDYTADPMPAQKIQRGRPKKFGRPARSLTVTLPDDVIDRLRRINADVGRAIVGLVDRTPRLARKGPPPASLASYGRHAVILVTPVPVLRRFRGVQLVPFGNGRALIALDHPHGIPQFELELRDALEKRDLKSLEREVLESVAEILKDARQSRLHTVAERSIIVLDGRRSSSPA